MKKEQLAFKNQKCALWPTKYGNEAFKVCSFMKYILQFYLAYTYYTTNTSVNITLRPFGKGT